MDAAERRAWERERKRAYRAKKRDELVASPANVTSIGSGRSASRGTLPNNARSAVELRPGLDVIYISGIPHEIAVRLNLLKADGNFVAKPFSAERLAAQVSTALSYRQR